MSWREAVILDEGSPKVADVYLKEAYNGYLRWGANGKAAHLGRKISALKLEEAHLGELQQPIDTNNDGNLDNDIENHVKETDRGDMISRAVRNISDETEPDKNTGFIFANGS